MTDAARHNQPQRQPRFHLSHPDHHIPGYELPETASTPPSRTACLIGFIIACCVAAGGYALERVGDGALTPAVDGYWVLPFVLLLACIATMPFIAKHFWEKNYYLVSAGLAILVSVYYVFFLGAGKTMAASFSEYISFIFLLGSLFVVSGGVIIRVRHGASPLVNVLILLTGAALANVLGTTGASMLLIRPFLRTNHGRVRPYHVVFFIFMVSNVGGALTPIGDPPLFLGYLRGVPFWWVLQHCWLIWLTALMLLSAVFLILDFRRVKSANPAAPDEPETDLKRNYRPLPPIAILGGANLLWILLILAGVFCPSPIREIMMAAAAFGSLAMTSRRIYGENHFNHAPIKEVAYLFIGIFATMVPAMNYLHNHAGDPAFKQNLNTPGKFYFASGALSSVLDNAPTYVTFLETALGKIQADQRPAAVPAPPSRITTAPHAPAVTPEPTGENHELTLLLNDSSPTPDGQSPLWKYLAAISMGAVFFGACTYIGNGPNFMVKSIAQHAGVETPSFFAYILFYTLPIFLPILILCWYLFLR